MLISNKTPANAGPIIFPRLIYEVIIPAAKPCSSPANFETSVLTAGRSSAVAVKNTMDTINIIENEFTNNIQSIPIAEITRFTSMTRISPNLLNKGPMTNVCAMVPTKPPTVMMYSNL